MDTKVCTKCGIEKPLDAFEPRSDRPGRRRTRCRECGRERKRKSERERYASNKEKFSAKNRMYREANKDALNEKRRVQRSLNPEKTKEQHKRYRESESNREKELAYSRRYEAEHRKERVIKSTNWKRNNPDKSRAIKTKHEAAKKNASGSFTSADIRSILTRQGGMCAYHALNASCQGDIRHRYEIDHIVPLSRGGSNWPKNLQLLCRHCNASKNSKTHDEFLAVLLHR